MRPTIDSARAPLFVVKVPAQVTPDEIEAHFDELAAAIAADGRRVAILVDLVDADLLSPELRHRTAQRMSALYPEVRGRIVGVAHVVGSGITLSAMTAILWIAPPPHATLVTRSMEEALAWAQRRLDGTPPAS